MMKNLIKKILKTFSKTKKHRKIKFAIRYIIY